MMALGYGERQSCWWRVGPVVVLVIGALLAIFIRASNQGDLLSLQLLLFAPLLMVIGRVLPLGLIWFALLGLGLSFVSLPRSSARDEVAIAVADSDRFAQHSTILKDSLAALMTTNYRDPVLLEPKFRIVHEPILSVDQAQRRFERSKGTPIIISPVDNGLTIFFSGELSAPLHRLLPDVVNETRFEPISELSVATLVPQVTVRGVHRNAVDRFTAALLYGLLPKNYIGGVSVFGASAQADQWLQAALYDQDHWFMRAHRGFAGFMAANRYLLNGLAQHDNSALVCAEALYNLALAFSPLREAPDLRGAIINNLAITQAAQGLLRADTDRIRLGFNTMMQAVRQPRGSALQPNWGPLVAKANILVIKRRFKQQFRADRKLKKSKKAIKTANQRGGRQHGRRHHTTTTT